MCIIFLIRYFCTHTCFLESPLLNACEPMLTTSTATRPAYCDYKKTRSQEIPSDNVCPGCSASLFLLEKRYQVTKAVHAAGGTVKDLQPLTADEFRRWRRWRADRERFRAQCVWGGKDGELGRGWRLWKGTDVGGKGGRDRYREVGRGWMSERYGEGVMAGWEEDSGFDGFLGEMGGLELELEGGPWGMSIKEIKEGVQAEEMG